MRNLKSALSSLAVGLLFGAAFMWVPPPHRAQAQPPPIVEELAGAPGAPHVEQLAQVELPVEVPAPVPEAVPTPAPAEQRPPFDLGQFAAAVAVIAAVVLFARMYFPKHLAPEPATPRSKTLCRTLALVLGIVLGLASVAPAVSPGVAGQLCAGIIAAALAAFGTSYLTTAAKALGTQS